MPAHFDDAAPETPCRGSISQRSPGYLWGPIWWHQFCFGAALGKPEKLSLLLPLHREICTAHHMPGGELNRRPTIENVGSICLWPDFEPPFCAVSVTVNLDDGGIHTSIFHIGIARQSLENPRKNIRFHPVTIAPKGRVPLAELGRKIVPGTAGSGNPSGIDVSFKTPFTELGSQSILNVNPRSQHTLAKRPKT